MDKKKLEKVLSIIMITIMFICTIFSCVSAIEPSNVDGTGSKADTNSVINIGQTVFSIIRTAGILISVIVLVVLGIKYMMGSAEEKAEYKKTLMPYVIGALLIFSASALSQVLYNLFKDITA